MHNMVLVHDPGVKESRRHFEECRGQCKVLLWDHDTNTTQMQLWQDKYGGAHKFPYYLIEVPQYILIRRYFNLDLNILNEESVEKQASTNKYFDFLSFEDALDFKKSASKGVYIEKYLTHTFPEQTVLYRNCFSNGDVDERKKVLPSFEKTIRFFRDSELDEYKKIHKDLLATKEEPTIYTNNVTLMPEDASCDLIIQ